MASVPTERCPLCGHTRPLCNSHIIPEFFYTPIYDENHRLYERDRRTAFVQFEQKGHREFLLCQSCDKQIGDRYENYFKEAWYDQGGLPSAIDFSKTRIAGLDYRRFKLCLLSILWRASLAKQELFEHVRLGAKREEILRSMLLADDPGPQSRYPFLADVLYLKNYVVESAILQPVPRTYKQQPGYMFAFGGCVWHFLLGTDRTGQFTRHTLGPNGDLPISWQNLVAMPIIRQFVTEHLSAPERPVRRRAN